MCSSDLESKAVPHAITTDRGTIRLRPQGARKICHRLLRRTNAQSGCARRVQMQKYAAAYYYDGPMHDQDAPAECKKNMPQATTTDPCKSRMRPQSANEKIRYQLI